jgi:predicted ATPase
LYGREKEQRQLQSAMQHALNGEPGLQFVSGFAGSGKTSLVNELRFPVAAAGGRFISGKFDQTLRGLPYMAFADAFSQLCHQLLAGTPNELAVFRNRVLETLGANAGLLMELVPILETVIGPQKTPPPLDTFESSNRFAVALLGFFNCLVSEENPLVLFLDDMQWADTASLELLHMIVSRTVSKHFLLICAYRDDEMKAGQPLPVLLETLQVEWPQLRQLSVRGLSTDHATSLVADVLGINTCQAAPLAKLIHEKTDGNPFFLRQLLETLVSEGALHYEPGEKTWQWESEHIRMLNISDNVIELMLRKIARMPSSLRKILQVAACIGSTFSTELLASVYGENAPTQSLLAPAIKDGLVALLGANARFTHDRIQQSVYQTLTELKARQIHLAIGRYLLKQRQDHDPPLAAVQQLNIGASLIKLATEQRQLAELNLVAGDSARVAMAYAEARDFYTMGTKLLVDSGDAAEGLRFELQFHQAETAFYLGEVEPAVGRLHELLTETTDLLSRTRIYQLLLDIHTTGFKLQKAMETGLEALAALGVTLPEDRSEVTLMASIQEIDRIIAEHDIEQIDNWPQMTDERELAIIGLLMHLAPPAYISAAQEMPFIIVELARRSLKGGLSRFSPVALSSYGMLLAVNLKQYDTASTIGRLALETADCQEGKPLRARANFFVATFIMHWHEPLEATLPCLDDGWKSGIETGDLQFASYCINHMHGNSLFASQSLVELEQSFTQFANIDCVITQEDGQYFFSLLRYTVEALLREDEELFDPAAKIGGILKVNTWHESGNATMVTCTTYCAACCA